MIIKNGSVLNYDFKFIDTDIETKDGIILSIGKASGDAELDASGRYVVPGFVDTHMHSAMGKTFIDFDDETYRTITVFEAKNGTVSLVPAISAAPKKKLHNCIAYMKDCCKKKR